MADYRVSLIIDLNGYGKSETYYWAGQNALGLADCIADTKRLVQYRRALLGKECSVIGASIRAYPPNNVGRTYYQEVGAGPGSLSPPDNDLNYPWSAMVAQVTDSTKHFRRQLMLTGIYDQLLGKLFNPGGAGVAGLFWSIEPAWTNFASVLTYASVTGAKPGKFIGHWAMRVRGRYAPGTFAPVLPLLKFPILDITSAGLGELWQVNVATPSGLKIGDRVHVHGASGCSYKGVNGDHTVRDLVVIPGRFDVLTLDKRNCCGAAERYNGLATLKKVEYVLTYISDATVNSVRIRKAGISQDPATKGKGRRACCG